MGERLAPFACGAHVLPAAVWFAGEVVAPGRVRVRGRERVVVPDGSAGRAFAALFAGTRLHVELTDDFLTESWRKLILNAVAGLEVLAGRRSEMFARADVRELAARLAAECIAVGRAEGARVDDEPGEIAARFAASPPDMSTSILFDRLAGRPLEWRERNGVICELGARHGIATPVSDVIVPLLAAASGEL